ncbi:Uncharacterized conserved protein [Ceraceosorus bombacis]|uniref:ER membrane protein complex subunit 2 n=1 Tax=Ceraceosorus bombacis TaxID=401625 RepID=A0A0N7LBA3_9BASI|nr:Uncharacterized conserved protein [Ceraceosorus bombacis]
MSAPSTSKRSVAQALDFLAEQRRRPDRRSQEVVACGELILLGGHLNALGQDELWSLLEQIAIAALDVGNWEVAELCVSRLNTRFPESSRVASLQGMLLEARGEASKALDFYQSQLAKDPTDVTMAKRRIAVMKAIDPNMDPRGGVPNAILALRAFLDHYYADAEGWQELAGLYANIALYPQAIFALEELQLLQPQNIFVVLQLAETQYTNQELEKAYTSFLRVVDMCDRVDPGTRNTGPWLRSLWGLKATTSKLLQRGDGASVIRSGTKEDQAAFSLSKVKEVDALITDLILNRAYISSSKDGLAGPRLTREAARALLAAAS